MKYKGWLASYIFFISPLLYKKRPIWRVIVFKSRHLCSVLAINKLNNCKSFHYEANRQMSFFRLKILIWKPDQKLNTTAVGGGPRGRRGARGQGRRALKNIQCISPVCPKARCQFIDTWRITQKVF